jgi:translation initiation factor 2B subunit (eIF-2B alpha/beta/delta family)
MRSGIKKQIESNMRDTIEKKNSKQLLIKKIEKIIEEEINSEDRIQAWQKKNLTRREKKKKKLTGSRSKLWLLHMLNLPASHRLD